MSEMGAQKIWVNLQSQLSEENYFSCKLSVHSKYEKVSEFILDCLNEQDMDFMIENTQFGNLIKYAVDYNLSSQILWFMMMRQVYATDDDEMWFVVNDRPVRFSRMEYALITGLDCSDNFPEEIVEVSDFCDRYFQGSDKVSVKEVEIKLKDLKSVDELLSMERVKMACLYFVCSVLWPIAPVKNPQVDKEIFCLMDDFDVFNKYPWGTIAFKRVVYDLKLDLKKKEVALSKKTEKGKSSNNGTHDMVGFINPLQILAYECVRGIGERFAKQREGDNTALPRMCQWISNNWSKKGSPRYIDILDASKSGKKVVRSILSPTDQESTAPYIRNISIEDSCTDSHLAYINSLLMEGKSVYCTKNPTLCESKETIQSKEEVHERKLCPKNKSKKSSKRRPAKKALEKQSHQVKRDDVLGQSDISGQVKALQEHVDRNFVELKDMISNLDGKLERIMEVLNISSSSKRRFDEPTTVFAQSKKKKTHEKCETGTTVSNQGGTLGQEAIVEPFISPLTHLDNPVKEVTSVNRDLNEGMSREEEVFDALNNATHHLVGEPQKTSIVECGDKEAAHASLVGIGDVATMLVNDNPLPQEITPSLAVQKDARKSTKSQFCRSPYVQLPETPALAALGYTGPYNGSFEPVQCVSIKKVLPIVTKEISRLNDLFKAGVFGSYCKSWFTDLLNPRHWLDQNHIQESMYGLYELQKTYPHLVKQDVAIMDPYFSQDLVFAYRNAPDDFENSKWKNLFRYVDGYCRRWSSVPWANASFILIPLNLPIHWVAVVVNVKDGIITMYDCNHSCYTDAEMNVYIEPIEDVVQHLLHYCKVKIPNIWTVARPKDFPQNASSSDCGAWMIKTFEVVLSQQSPYSLNDQIVNSYRKYLATSVWYGEWIL